MSPVGPVVGVDDVTGSTARRLPEFRSVEEAAEFFDTHDMGDCADDWEQVDDVRFEPAQPENGVWLRLDDEIRAALTERARELRMSPATLARRWVMERLAQLRGT
jgi:hypothetical protein